MKLKPGRQSNRLLLALTLVLNTEAMIRELTGRLRRDSWLVSKKRRYLGIGLHIFMTFRNYVRPRFSGEKQSPAQRLGFVSRFLSVG